MSPGSAYLGPGLPYRAAIGPLGLWGLQVPTQDSALDMTLRGVGDNDNSNCLHRVS